MMFKRQPKEPWTHIGTGVHLDHPDTIMEIGFPDNFRKGHFWCFGTTRVGKTRIMEHIIDQDIRKGYSVVAIDPKGDIDLFSKITQLADDTGRLNDLMLITPIFPQYSAILDPLSSYYMPEELVGHITAGVAVGREPYFFGVAYEVSLVVVQSLIMLAEIRGTRPSFNLNDIKNHISHQDLERLKEKIDYIDTPDAQQLSMDMQKIISTPPDYYSKVASSLRVALTELTSGNVGRIIGKADENRFIKRLEEGKTIILVVQLGSLLTKRAAYTAGKVIISMIQAFVGRVYSCGKKVTPSLVLHMDEAQSILYHGIEDLFAKAGGAGIFIHGYCQSINQLYSEVGEDRANTILDNCNTKLFMRVPDASTAYYVSRHLGEERRFSPIISVGGGLSIRETEEVRIKHTEVLNMAPRELFLNTYSGTYKGKTATVRDGLLKVRFPDLGEEKKSRVKAEAEHPDA